MAKKNYLYMIVTADEYELPIGVFESECSIARAFRVSRQAVHYCVTKKALFRKKYYIIFVTMSSNNETRDIIKSQRQKA